MTATSKPDDRSDSSAFAGRLLAFTGLFEAWPLGLRLGAATLAVAAGLALRIALLGASEGNAYVTFYPAVGIAAVFGGLSGGVLATLLSVAAVQEWVSPYARHEDLLALLAFLVGAVVIVSMLRLLHFALAARLGLEFQRRREAQFRAIVDAALEGMVAVDKQGVIQYANPAAQEMYGYKNDEMIGRNVKMLMPEPDRSRHDTYIAHYLRTGEKKIIGARRRVFGVRKNGEVFPKELTISRAPFGDDVLFVGMMRDLTAIEREKTRANVLRDELAHAARLNDMGEVVAGIAHEVSQPLMAIANFLAAARRKLPDEEYEAVAETIHKAEEQTLRASDILSRLRRFIEKRAPEQVAAELQPLIREAVEIACMGEGRRQKRIEFQMPEAPIMVKIDRVHIQQVLVNLLRNAGEALAAQPAPGVVIEAKIDRAGFVTVSVADNGPGVPAETAEKLFQPFVTTKSNGMGIGLSLCRSIVESNGGKIGFKPNEPHGAVFFFTLPMMTPQEH